MIILNRSPKPGLPLAAHIAAAPEPDLAALLSANLRWEQPRGNLLHWVDVLNRIDDIFERLVARYGYSADAESLAEPAADDTALLVACLAFSTMLMEHCANRTIYASADRIWALLSCPNPDVRLRALEMAVCLGERYVGQSMQKKYAAPKAVRGTLVQLARAYPPPVPPGFLSKRRAEKHEAYGLVDTLDAAAKPPPKWRQVHFRYYVHDKKKRPDGVAVLAVGDDAVRKLLLPQLYLRAQDLPPEALQAYAAAAASAKAFSGRLDECMALRRTLVRTKCLAVAATCALCPSEYTSSHLFEAEPYVLSSVLDLVAPEHSGVVGPAVFLSATKALECMLMKRVWGGDLFRGLGANVGHGMLYRLLRHVLKQTREGDNRYEEGHLNLFSFLGNLIDAKVLTARLAAGTLLADLTAFLTVRSPHRRTCSAAVNTISVFVGVAEELVLDFANLDGFAHLVATINHEVDTALAANTPLPLRQANYLRNLLRLVANLVQSDAGDRLRNLFDSPLLLAFSRVIGSSALFGAPVVAATVDAVRFILHNEPTAYAILDEAGVIRCIFANYKNLFYPSSDLLFALVEILGAIALNETGLDEISSENLINQYYEAFYNPEFAAELVKSDMSTNIGCLMDELGRHNQQLAPDVDREFLTFLEKLPSVIEQHVEKVHFYEAPDGNLYRHGDAVAEARGDMYTWDTCAAKDIVEAALSFTAGFTQDYWSKCVADGVEPSKWLRLLTVRGMPYDFTASSAMFNLVAVFRSLITEVREYGCREMLECFYEHLKHDAVQAFLAFSGDCYFALVPPHVATETLEQLNILHTLMHMLSEVYFNPQLIVSERFETLMDFLASKDDFLHDLGRLTSRSLLEEIWVRSALPKDLLEHTAAIIDTLTHVVPTPIHGEPSSVKLDAVQGHAKFKNTVQIRFFMNHFQRGAADMFACVARSCLQRRIDQHSSEWRRNAVVATRQTAHALAHLFNTHRSLLPEESANAAMVAMDLIVFVVACKDKGKEVYSAPLVLYFFFETNLWESITTMAIQCFDELLKADNFGEKPLNKVSNNATSYRLHFLDTMLLMTIRALRGAYITKMPHSGLYFFKDYCMDENAFPRGIKAQMAAQELRFITSTIGSESQPYKTNNYAALAKFPVSVVEHLVTLIKALEETEPVDEFYELKENWMTPPHDQVMFLIDEVGMSPPVANQLLKNHKGVKEVHQGDFAELEDPDMAACKVKLQTMDLGDRFEYEPRFTDTIERFEAFNEMELGLLYNDVLLHIIAHVGSLDKMTVPLIKAKRSDKVYGHVLDRIKELSDPELLANTMSLLTVLLREYPSREYGEVRQATFYSCVDHFVAQLQRQPEFAKTAYFVKGIEFIEPILTQTAPSFLEGAEHCFPSLRSDTNLKLRVLDVLLSVDCGENLEPLVALCQILFLYAKDPVFKPRVASSDTLRKIVVYCSALLKQKSNAYENLQESFILLIRVCHENSLLVETLMSTEIVKHFTKHAGGRRDLRQLVEDSKTLLARDPKTFVDTVSKLVRVEDFDSLLYSSESLFLVDLPEHEEERSDANLFDSADESLLHFLLSQLIETSKKDWVSSPELDKSDAQKELHFQELMKNKHFGYMCLLLQTITELVGSYKEAKLHFVTFSFKEKTDEKRRPKALSLNFLILQLIPTQAFVSGSNEELQRREAISSLAKLCVLALISTPVLKYDRLPEGKKEDADMAILRRLLADIVFKTFKDLLTAQGAVAVTYSKLFDVLDLCGCILSSKFREMCFPLLSKSSTKLDPYYIASALIEKNVPNQIACVMADTDLNFPQMDKLIKVCLKPLTYLAKIKIAHADLFENNEEEDDIPDDEDERDDTPDLLKNSTLGMYDTNLDSDEYYDEGYYDAEGDEEMLSEDDSDDQMESDLFSEEEGESEDYDDDVEIIDELEGDVESETFSDESEASNFYGIDSSEQEDVTGDDSQEEDYTDRELDGWIEAFADEADAENGSEEEEEFHFGNRYSRSGHDHGHGHEHEHVHSEEQLEDLADYDSNESDHDMDEDDLHPLQARDIVSSFVDALRPALGQQTSSGFLARFLSRTRTLLLHDPLSQLLNPTVEVMFSDHQHQTDNYMYIRSTLERWKTLYEFSLKGIDAGEVEEARKLILEAIKEDSLRIWEKKREETERLNKEKEERARRRREEMQQKREEESSRRELEAQPQREPVMLRIGDREVDISGTDIDPEFFEALPDDMREEVFTQHVRERRATATLVGGDVREIDPDFLDALPDQIRAEILHHESVVRRGSGLGYDDDIYESEEQEETMEEPPEPKPKKRTTFAQPLVDRLGVASLVRLLFVPQPMAQREHIYSTLANLSNNKQTRVEVMSLLIAVLHEGLGGQKNLEKSFGMLSSRAHSGKCLSSAANKLFPIGGTPTEVGDQVIEAVFYVLERNIPLRYYLLREHENPFVSKKSRAEKYPINLLLGLMNNPLLSDEHFFVDSLSSVLCLGTRPLTQLLEKNKEHPPLATDSIPESNLKLLVRILSSNDCSNSTFRQTISTMQNLLVMKGAEDVLTKELSARATQLGSAVIEKLKDLRTFLESDETFDSENKTFNEFTAPNADQTKLLRILTALDYMFEMKRKRDGEEGEQDLLKALYKHIELGSLWEALSGCLLVIGKFEDASSIATALLPLIEALMVVCKHSKIREIQIKDVVKYEAKKIDYSKEPIDSLFFAFTDEHKKILNQMVRSNLNLMSGPFSMLVRNPRVLEFDNKKNYFDRQLHKLNKSSAKLIVNIRRDQVFLDSYRALFFKSVEEFRDLKLDIKFKGEAGIDAGGVTREWYQVLSRQMFNPDYALFTAVASDETTFHPNRTSYINPEHLSFFKFIGRVIGKAIHDGAFLDCHFSRAVYKKILGQPASLKDMETLDLEYFKSLMWMLENDITDIITEDFSVELDDYGEHKVIDLIPNGRNIPVTEENKHEYVRLVVEYRLHTSVVEQMNNFITGFHEIVPKDLVTIFDEQELELLISGLPEIDVADWQSNSSYNNYLPSLEQIQWFWRAVKSFDNEERAKLLQFATGTSKVPLNGFKGLRGANGECKFSIHRDYGSTERLPSLHTCFNQVDLPAYESYETLRGLLLLAITEGHEGFGLA